MLPATQNCSMIDTVACRSTDYEVKWEMQAPLTFLRGGKTKLLYSDLQKESYTTPDYYRKTLID